MLPIRWLSLLLMLTTCLPMISARNPYEVLGVPRDAVDRVIKKEYMRLAKKWHPDRNDSPQSATKMTAINRAYETLSNPTKRKLFDMTGTDDPQQQKKFRGRQFRSSYGRKNKHTRHQQSHQRPRQRKQHHQRQQPKPKHYKEIELTLEQLYSGGTVTVQKKDDKTGRNKLLTVKFEAGAKDGDIVKADNHGLTAWYRIKEKKHKLFTRSGTGLEYTAKITLTEALAGVTISVPTLDGRTLSVEIDDTNTIVTPGYWKFVSNEGMPIKGRGTRGMLNINFDIQFPKSLSESERNLIRDQDWKYHARS